MIRVLVADDHPTILLGLEMVLGAEGDITFCGSAPDGETACALVAASAPDVVVMDVEMPGIGGIEATRRIRRDFPGTRVVILTWSTDPATRVRALEAGASRYLLKDGQHDALLGAIRGHAPGYVA
jgi:DNA-binding NarL/FixJ family response regulator